MGLLGVVTLIFVIAKVFGIGIVANWSWWLIFAPALIGVVILLVIVFLAALAAYYLDK